MEAAFDNAQQWRLSGGNGECFGPGGRSTGAAFITRLSVLERRRPVERADCGRANVIRELPVQRVRADKESVGDRFTRKPV